jgi:hypothetical protein
MSPKQHQIPRVEVMVNDQKEINDYVSIAPTDFGEISLNVTPNNKGSIRSSQKSPNSQHSSSFVSTKLETVADKV